MATFCNQNEKNEKQVMSFIFSRWTISVKNKWYHLFFSKRRHSLLQMNGPNFFHGWNEWKNAQQKVGLSYFAVFLVNMLLHFKICHQKCFIFLCLTVLVYYYSNNRVHCIYSYQKILRKNTYKIWLVYQIHKYLRYPFKIRINFLDEFS